MKDAIRLQVAIGCAIGFLALTLVVSVHPTIAGDHAIGERLLAQPDTIRWDLAVIVSFLASGPIVALTGAIAALWTVWRMRRPAAAVAILAAPLLAAVIEVATKSLVGRARPVTASLSGESGNGYPSGHVSGFAALAVALLVVWVLDRPATTSAERRVAVLLVGVMIAVVAWSRVALGAHYATDTVGAALLGISIGTFCPWISDRAWDRWHGNRSSAVLPSAEPRLNRR